MLLLLLIDGIKPQVEVGELIIYILIELAIIEAQRAPRTMAPGHQRVTDLLLKWHGPGTPSCTLNSNTNIPP